MTYDLRKLRRMPSYIHDEVVYQWRRDMKDAVYAVDEAGVVHLWYSLPAVVDQGISGCCILPRTQIVRFLVVAEPTCMACIATAEDFEQVEGPEDSLEKWLWASLNSITGE